MLFCCRNETTVVASPIISYQILSDVSHPRTETQNAAQFYFETSMVSLVVGTVDGALKCGLEDTLHNSFVL